MKKILAIGNSFSQDATAYLESLAPDLYVRDLVIGGCSLETHAANLASGAHNYAFEENAVPLTREKVSANEILSSCAWDYVTVQQVSQLAGAPESYEPHLSRVLSFLRELAPHATVLFHETWAYAKDSTHAGFAYYGGNQRRMYDAVRRVTREMAASHGLPVIPTGDFLQSLRETGPLPGEDYTRDGFHLRIPEGRYAAALVWAGFFGSSLTEFIPEGADPAVIRKIRDYYQLWSIRSSDKE